MKYEVEDLKNMSKLLAGLGGIDLPDVIKINEKDLYECCYDMGWDTQILDNNTYNINVFSKFLIQLANEDQLIAFVDYYFSCYFEKRITKLAESGYRVFEVKDKILTSLNSIWSIPNQEFDLIGNGNKVGLKKVKFKEYDKMGEGGFSNIYCCHNDDSKVYKVLNTKEKADVGSVHRFKREYETMSKENESGYTIKVFDYDQQDNIYSMEKARVSLEDYIQNNELSDEEKDGIVIRCAECMKYLHDEEIIHRDFHPGNILLNPLGKWVVSDFGLARSNSSKYSYQTTTTKEVGRAWFTDPIQLVALKDGDYITDMFSLARTIDYIMNGNMSGESNKYSSVVYRATAPNRENRYNDINEMYNDIKRIYMRKVYKSSEEEVDDLIKRYKESKNFDTLLFIDILNKEVDDTLMWRLVVKYGKEMLMPFMKVVDISFMVALREIRRLSTAMEEGRWKWEDYDPVGKWAIDLIYERKKKDDEISIIAARIVSYVAYSVNRFAIQDEVENLKADSSIEGSIRAQILNY